MTAAETPRSDHQPNIRAGQDQAAPLRGAVPGPARAGPRPWGGRPGPAARAARESPPLGQDTHSAASAATVMHERLPPPTRAELGGDAEARGGHGIPAGYRDPGTSHRFRPKPQHSRRRWGPSPDTGSIGPPRRASRAGRSFRPAPPHGPNPTGCPLARAEPLRPCWLIPGGIGVGAACLGRFGSCVLHDRAAVAFPLVPAAKWSS